MKMFSLFDQHLYLLKQAIFQSTLSIDEFTCMYAIYYLSLQLLRHCVALMRTVGRFGVRLFALLNMSMSIWLTIWVTPNRLFHDWPPLFDFIISSFKTFQNQFSKKMKYSLSRFPWWVQKYSSSFCFFLSCEDFIKSTTIFDPSAFPQFPMLPSYCLHSTRFHDET